MPPFTRSNWRTNAGAEVDFVIYQNDRELMPIEVKYQRFSKPAVTRSFRSLKLTSQSKLAF